MSEFDPHAGRVVSRRKHIRFHLTSEKQETQPERASRTPSVATNASGVPTAAAEVTPFESCVFTRLFAFLGTQAAWILCAQEQRFTADEAWNRAPFFHLMNRLKKKKDDRDRSAFLEKGHSLPASEGPGYQRTGWTAGIYPALRADGQILLGLSHRRL